MTITISIGTPNGGVGKTTTASVLAYLLSQQHKVLAIDMDVNGNMTQVLTGIEDIYELDGCTIYDALLNEDASKYIIKITDNLHMLASDEKIAALNRYFHVLLPREHKKTYHQILQRTLSNVLKKYDYIIIDNPSAARELSVASLSASDFVVIMYGCHKFSYSALERYMVTIETVQKHINPKLKIAGIFRTLIDKRRSNDKYFSELVKEEFGDLCFNTVIKRSVTIRSIDSFGVIGNPEIKKIIKHYKPFVMELIQRVRGNSRFNEKIKSCEGELSPGSSLEVIGIRSQEVFNNRANLSYSEAIQNKDEPLVGGSRFTTTKWQESISITNKTTEEIFHTIDQSAASKEAVKSEMNLSSVEIPQSNPQTKDMELKSYKTNRYKKQRLKETYIQRSYYIEKEIAAIIDDIVGENIGGKYRLINDALKLLIYQEYPEYVHRIGKKEN